MAWLGATPRLAVGLIPLLGACLGVAEYDAKPHDGGAGVDASVGGGGFPSGGSGGSGGTGPAGTSGSAGSVGGSGGGGTTLKPGFGLSGDGVIAHPNLCGSIVMDSYGGDFKELLAGVDYPCQSNAVYRSFVRFDLTPLAGIAPKTATLRFFYGMPGDSVTGALDLLQIGDFGAVLDDSDWNLAPLKDYGPKLDVSTPLGWIEQDVLAELQPALSQGRPLVFEFRYTTEFEDPGGHSRFFAIVAVDDPSGNGPQLVVTW